ncbi:MAG: acyloxyacyl hydrolase [Bacteroidales bacterium]|nr:acyloxyacyl hydrolase [Bacteroidales bacterium]
MLKRVYIIIVLLLLCNALVSQNKNNLSLTFGSGYGWVAPINNFVRGINDDNKKVTSMANFSLRLTKEVDGSNYWHYWYNGFYYGAGLFYGHFNYSKNLGNPFALYGLMGFNFFHTKNLSLKAEMALGFSGIWTPYKESNRCNVAVSTPVESYIHADLEAYYSLNRHWQINLGAAFIHFSNGNMKQPNKGINVLTPVLGFSYIPVQLVHINRKDLKNYFPKEKQELFKAHWQSQYNITLAQKGVYVFYSAPDENNVMQQDTARGVYGIFGMQARYLKKFALNHAFGFGFDLTYNQSIGKNDPLFYYPGREQDNMTYFQKFTLSSFISYEYNIYRASLLLEPGLYLFNKDKSLPRLSEHILLRYQFNGGIFAQIGIRAYDFRKADYIEWGVGYRIRHKVKSNQ